MWMESSAFSGIKSVALCMADLSKSFAGCFRGVPFQGTTIGLAPLKAMCSEHQSGGVNSVKKPALLFNNLYLFPIWTWLISHLSLSLCLSRTTLKLQLESPLPWLMKWGIILGWTMTVMAAARPCQRMEDASWLQLLGETICKHPASHYIQLAN